MARFIICFVVGLLKQTFIMRQPIFFVVPVDDSV